MSYDHTKYDHVCMSVACRCRHSDSDSVYVGSAASRRQQQQSAIGIVTPYAYTPLCGRHAPRAIRHACVGVGVLFVFLFVQCAVNTTHLQMKYNIALGYRYLYLSRTTRHKCAYISYLKSTQCTAMLRRAHAAVTYLPAYARASRPHARPRATAPRDCAPRPALGAERWENRNRGETTSPSQYAMQHHAYA